MTSEEWARIRDLVHRALDRPPAERSDWLEEVCEDEPDVRAEVESLLEAYQQDDSFFDEQVVARSDPGNADTDPDSGASPSLPSPDARVGSYRLVEEIGVGGMSVVYRAERVDGEFEQTVAIKLLQRRLRSDDAEQRFRTERQVLASLDHPNIAQLLDGGVTDGGRPFLVLEYVDGVPLTEYADMHNLGLDARLDLLDQVFDAVRAAHRQLVVHRDLKPSNVLVTETESGPHVRLLDFGIAKLLGDAVPVTNPKTKTGLHLMTPSYAAPEQITGGEITTETDVYQLGVLAYELLAGTRPFDLSDKSPTEVEEVIVENPPPRPSTHAPSLEGDLDTILLNALRKEPERRYRSVESLEADLKRYRRREPIQARSATLSYRSKKFLSRHRWGISVAAAFLLLVSIAGAMLEQQRSRAKKEAQTAEQVSSYLVDLFEASDPLANTNNPSARDLVQRGMDRIDRLAGEPLVQAEMVTALGRAATKLEQWNRADSLLHRGLSLRQNHLDAPHPALVSSWTAIGTFYKTTYDFSEARPAFKTALTMSRDLGSDEHRADILAGLSECLERMGSPDSAAALRRRAIELRERKRGPDYRSRPLGRTELAGILRRTGQHDRAKTLFQTSLDRIQSDTSQYPVGQRAAVHSDFALLLNNTGDYAQAEDHARTALALCRRVAEPGSHYCRRTQSNLYGALVQQGKYDQARAVRRNQLENAKQQYDPPHYRLAVQHSLYGAILSHTGHGEKGLHHLRRGADLMEQYAGPDNLWTHNSNLRLALGLIQKDREQSAERLLDQATPVVRKTHPDSTSFRLSKIKAMIAIGRGEIEAHRKNWAQAESLFVQGYQARRSTAGRGVPLCQRALRNLVEVYEATGRPARAAAYRDSLFLQ